MYETAKETLMYRTVLWTLWERERVGRFGRMAMKHVKYHVGNELPVQIRCMMLDAWGWCTGKTQRDGMGREEGGGFRMERKYLMNVYSVVNIHWEKNLSHITEIFRAKIKVF